MAEAARLKTVEDEEFQALWNQQTKRVMSGEGVSVKADPTLVELAPKDVVDWVDGLGLRLVEYMKPAAYINLHRMMESYTIPEEEQPAPYAFWRCAVDGMDAPKHKGHCNSLGCCTTCKNAPRIPSGGVTGIPQSRTTKRRESRSENKPWSTGSNT